MKFKKRNHNSEKLKLEDKWKALVKANQPKTNNVRKEFRESRKQGSFWGNLTTEAGATMGEKKQEPPP